jgi:3-hydroxyacyl-CoA dehydrogenase
MRLAVIGTGYWGSKIVETVKNMGLPVTLYDVNDSLDGIVPSLIDGVIIATPAPTHKDITKRMLRKGIHVLSRETCIHEHGRMQRDRTLHCQCEIDGRTHIVVQRTL